MLILRFFNCFQIANIKYIFIQVVGYRLLNLWKKPSNTKLTWEIQPLACTKIEVLQPHVPDVAMPTKLKQDLFITITTLWPSTNQNIRQIIHMQKSRFKHARLLFFFLLFANDIFKIYSNFIYTAQHYLEKCLTITLICGSSLKCCH